MKKKIAKHHMFRTLLTLAVAAAGIFLLPTQAEAKEVSVPAKCYLDVSPDAKKYGENLWDIVEIKNFNYEKDSITAVSVTKPSLVKVKNTNGYYLYPKKAGKTKLKLTVKHANGKTKKLSTWLITQKWKNPFKTFKIGKKDLKKLYVTRRDIQRDPGPNPQKNPYKGKLQLKAAKGWTLVSATMKKYNWDTGKYKTTKLKNGKIYTIEGDVFITFRDNKTKYIRTCILYDIAG